MKTVFAVAFCLIATTAFAADKPKDAPKPPACGGTIEDCQRVVDGLNKQIVELRTAFQAARQQRINARTAQDDAEINAAIAQQQQVSPVPH